MYVDAMNTEIYVYVAGVGFVNVLDGSVKT
jgi:hypothetical protein